MITDHTHMLKFTLTRLMHTHCRGPHILHTCSHVQSPTDVLHSPIRQPALPARGELAPPTPHLSCLPACPPCPPILHTFSSRRSIGAAGGSRGRGEMDGSAGGGSREGAPVSQNPALPFRGGGAWEARLPIWTAAIRTLSLCTSFLDTPALSRLPKLESVQIIPFLARLPGSLAHGNLEMLISAEDPESPEVNRPQNSAQSPRNSLACPSEQSRDPRTVCFSSNPHELCDLEPVMEPLCSSAPSSVIRNFISRHVILD